jgi:hypothetical protein
VHWKKQQILEVLDGTCRVFKFPMLDNGYVYLSATRLSLFRSREDWAMAIEIFGFSPRAGLPDVHIYTFASTLYNRDSAENYVSVEDYKNYLKNNPHNESRFVFPIEEGLWMDNDMPDHIAEVGVVVLRGRSIELPPFESYAHHGIRLEGDRPAIYELCRYLAEIRRDDVLATPGERRISILPEMEQILQLEEWHHPDVVSEELPSQVDSFRSLAEVLVTGNAADYRGHKPPNTHWKHWPDGGTL